MKSVSFAAVAKLNVNIFASESSNCPSSLRLNSTDISEPRPISHKPRRGSICFGRRA